MNVWLESLMRRSFCLIWLVVFGFLAPSAWGLERFEAVVQRADWPKYANGSNISALPEARAVLSRFREGGEVEIAIRYPGGDAGRLWGQQMVRWFVAFGVPVQYLSLEVGSGGADRLLLVLLDRG